MSAADRSVFSTPSLRSSRRASRSVRLVTRIVIPLLTVAFVVWRVDFAAMWDALGRTNLALLAVALAVFPARYVLRPVRWRLMQQGALGAALPFGEAARLSWIALGVGWLTPAGIGADVYRVAAASRRLGRPGVNAAVVVAEKLVMLVACPILLLSVAFFVPDAVDGHGDDVSRFVVIAAMGLMAVLVVATLMRLTVRARVVRWVDRRIQRAIAATLAAVRDRTSIDVRIPPGGMRGALKPLARFRVIAPGVGLSIGMMLATALTTQVIFQAIGYSIPITVNIFVVPLMTLIVALPISPGAIGVRESAAIVLYGMFGVPADVALLVSLFGLVGVAANSMAGALLFAVSRSRGDVVLDSSREAHRPEPAESAE